MNHITKYTTNLFKGICISSLYFYPTFHMLSASKKNAYLLHWQLNDTLIVFSLMLGSGFIIALLFPIRQRTSGPLYALTTGILYLITTISLMSILSIFSRSYMTILKHASSITEAALSALFVLIIIGILYATKKHKSIFRHLFYAISIYSITYTLITIGITIYDPARTFPQQHKPGHQITASPTTQSSIFIFLFDEWSYDFLYSKQGEVNKRWKNLQKISLKSRNYHQAFLSSTSTFENVLEFLGCSFPTCATKNNITQSHPSIPVLIKESGLPPVISGTYHPYQYLFDNHHQASIESFPYQVSNGHSFAKALSHLIDPILTWPKKYPFGLLSLPLSVIYSYHANSTIESITINHLKSPTHKFLYMHHLGGHTPYLYDKRGFSPNIRPYTYDESTYLTQFDYIDNLIGMILDNLQIGGHMQNSIIIFTSDHNLRQAPNGRIKHLNQVPLIIYNSKDPSHANIYKQINSGEVVASEIISLLPQKDPRK